MKKLGRLLIAGLLVLCTFLPQSANALTATTSDLLPSANYQYKKYDYVIDEYNIDIVVNENNSFDVTETIDAYFNTAKHGIFRTIPLANDITRLDGTTSRNRAQISNVSVSEEYTTSRENGNYKIKIGSASRTFTGEQSYTIKYTYNLGKDPSPSYDEVYYNIIGTEWDTVIGNVTFSIHIPKDFDASNVGFSSGAYGSTASDNVEYKVDGDTINGSYDGVLGPGEALTIRLELPEGYFVNAGLSASWLNYLMLIVPIVFLGISIFLWYKFGRDDTVVETVEFYPPEGFNSLDVGFLYKGKADTQGVTSLLIYLADKGYLKISETEEKSLFSKTKGFRITKVKDYDGDDVNERLFLKGLFAHKTLVTSADLYDKFYRTMNKILANTNTKENKYKIFEKSASSKSIFIILMIIATWCLITIPPVLDFEGPELLIPALLFPGIGFTLMFAMLGSAIQPSSINGRTPSANITVRLFGLLWGVMFGGIPWAALVLPALLQEPLYLASYGVGVACIVGMTICLCYLPKRTPYGNEMLGKIRGFKNFLETAEKEKLEAMVMQDPSYFYNILPYTYVLGVSDKWISKFETIALQAPDWYEGRTAFEVGVFAAFMDQTMTSAQNAMASSPSSSSSGGGSSGGGSGGGGGGSW